MELEYMQQEADRWIPIKTHSSKTPKGLHYLSQIEHPIVERYYGDLPGYLTIPQDNISKTFKILNQFGEQVYYAFEYTSEKPGGCCKRKSTNQTYHLTNRLGGTVFHFSHASHRDRVTVYCNDTELLGTIAIPASSWCKKPCYSIVDSDNNPQVHVVGLSDSFLRRCCGCWSCKQIYKAFKIQTTATKGNPAKPLGEITNHFLGMMVKNRTSTDTTESASRGRFGISFPAYINVQMKAVILAASFLIRDKYFDYAQTKAKPSQHALNAKSTKSRNTDILQADPTWVQTPHEQQTPKQATPSDSRARHSSIESSVDPPSTVHSEHKLSDTKLSFHDKDDSGSESPYTRSPSVTEMMKEIILPFKTQ